MTKKLPTKSITNELSGSSVFFQPQISPKPSPKPLDKDNKPNLTAQPADVIQPAEIPNKQTSIYATMPPSNHATVVARHHDAVPPLHHSDQKGVSQFGEIRKAVKQLGKEAATYRFRVEEKTAIADIVYTYTRQGVRTSENEITRIAVNWLLLDYRQNGANSVLARLLEDLHG